VPESVARTLGMRWGTGLSPKQALLHHLGPRESLLVLDNCEHLIEGVADLADALLRGCPGLKVLATSREALRVPGETAWQVPSLSLPETQRAQDPEVVRRYEALRLFAERATAVAPGFDLTSQNAADVVRICQRLDGIPLAIELAAASARVLTPAQIAARLDDRFLLLTSGSRVVMPRQRTLKATMDWSHDLLSERAGVVPAALRLCWWLHAGGGRGDRRGWRRGKHGAGAPLPAGGQVAGVRDAARRRAAVRDAGDGGAIRLREAKRGRRG
jgi:predicted ATPase